jgi:hypothetical protein
MSYVWLMALHGEPRSMTRKKLVSGIRLFTKSPRFKRIWEVTQHPRRGKSPRLYSDADPLFRFALSGNVRMELRRVFDVNPTDSFGILKFRQRHRSVHW